MTKETSRLAMMAPMKTNRLILHSLMASILTLPILAQEKSMSDGLRDALYLEEVKRDPAAAASAYESLLDGYAQQQQFAATALFRLAEIRRAEGRKDEAIALYQRLIAQFPNADVKTKLAKENLAALGAKMPEAGDPVVDQEALEFQRLKSMHESSPDLVDHKTLEAAVKNGYLRSVEWLMKDLRVQDVNKTALRTAAGMGNAKMTALLIELLGEASKEQLPAALSSASSKGYLQITRILLAAGANPNEAYEVAKVETDDDSFSLLGGCPLVVAFNNDHYEVADLLLESGANPNSVEGEERVTPLAALIVSKHKSKGAYLEKLIARGANIQTTINIPNNLFSDNMRVNNLLSLALVAGDDHVASTLLAKGIKKDRTDLFACIRYFSENQITVAELLIKAGVDPNSKVHGGLSLLALAYEREHRNLVKLLLEKGANPNVEAELGEDSDENIPNLTQKALYAGEVEDLLMFLHAGGDPGPQPKLDYAFNKDYTRNKIETPLSAVKTLVEKGFVPSSEWRRRNFEGASNEVIAYFNERFPAEKPKAEEKPRLDPFE